MNLIKHLHETTVVSTAKQKKYEAVKFPNGFIQFMESLVINELISSDYHRVKTENGIKWDDHLLNGGVILETSSNPLLETSDIIITGNKDAIETFEYLLRINEVESEKDDPWTDIGYTRKTTPTNVSAPPPPPDENKKPVRKIRINLNVPYSQRESAKKMGARWDAGIRRWYMFVSNEDLKKIPNAWR
ncbi:MAG: hypothetical protein EO766_11790 [Hydrotalea sp. AMD]|uniref:DUF5710 domain-containing protein n=1 Tax=Hydrotalea sp. AMD TaxID=2501297 RepID=UPI00102837C6|nr:DUF5710 domain-containing protein [Hydrotalea sp. AMD]RWZ87206.1 MAG: hypothetical protein EO766_11790 [Hydrotalea sp. AMD]